MYAAVSDNRHKRLTTIIKLKQKEIDDLKTEIIKIIRGESKLDAEMLNEMIQRNQIEIEENEDRLQQEQEIIRELEVSAKALEKEYTQIMT